MSNIFRDSESLGKSNGEKWSNIWTFLFGSGLKLPRKKKFFFADFALQNMVETTLPDGLLGFWVFLVHPPMALVLLSASVERCFVSRMRNFLVETTWRLDNRWNVLRAGFCDSHKFLRKTITQSLNWRVKRMLEGQPKPGLSSRCILA